MQRQPPVQPKSSADTPHPRQLSPRGREIKANLSRGRRVVPSTENLLVAAAAICAKRDVSPSARAAFYLEVVSKPATKLGGKPRVAPKALKAVESILAREQRTREANMRRRENELRELGRKIATLGRLIKRGREPRRPLACQASPRERRSTRRRTSSGQRSRSSSGDPGLGDSDEPPSRWLQCFSPLVSFADLHDLTPTLSGSERERAFDALPSEVKDAMWASLRAGLEGGRS